MSDDRYLIWILVGAVMLDLVPVDDPGVSRKVIGPIAYSKQAHHHDSHI